LPNGCPLGVLHHQRTSNKRLSFSQEPQRKRLDRSLKAETMEQWLREWLRQWLRWECLTATAEVNAAEIAVPESRGLAGRG
jgi:hypothetical protein